MVEVWKDVTGYEGLYMVSNLGRVKSVDRVVDKVFTSGKIEKKHLKGTILKVAVSPLGYTVVALCRNGKCKSVTVHRLVALAFLDLVQEKEFVNHINGVKTNNSVSNLEWCSRSENSKHAIRIGLKLMSGEDNSRSIPVININTGIAYPTIKIAAEANGITSRHLCKILRGEVANKTNLKYLNA